MLVFHGFLGPSGVLKTLGGESREDMDILHFILFLFIFETKFKLKEKDIISIERDPPSHIPKQKLSKDSIIIKHHISITYVSRREGSYPADNFLRGQL